MEKHIRNRLYTLFLAAVVGVTSIGTATFAAAEGFLENNEKIILDTQFSIPFEFLFFHLEESEQKLTEKDLEKEKNRIRELSHKAEEEAGLVFVYEYRMEVPHTLAEVDLSECKGDGTFAFACPEFVPDKGISVCEIMFIPNDAELYEYDQMLGWDEDTQTLRRYVEVICTSLGSQEEEVNLKADRVSSVDFFGTGAGKDELQDVDGKKTDQAVDQSIIDAESGKETDQTVIGETDKGIEQQPEEAETGKETEKPSTDEKVDADIDSPSHPAVSLVPEISTVPGISGSDEGPVVTPTPEPQVTAPVMQGILAEKGVLKIEKDDVIKSFEKNVSALIQENTTDGWMEQLLILTREYEQFTDRQKESVSSDVMDGLERLQKTAAEINHCSNGVTVTGNLPWYVQLVVTVGNDTETYVPSGLDTIVPYEMCLWDLLKESEYILDGGEKVTLSMAVPEKIHLYDGLVIVHYIDETHYEYIELQIYENTLSFETASFSPFNIAGSTVLVGGKKESTTQPSESVPTTKEELEPTISKENNNEKTDNKKTESQTQESKDKEQQNSGKGTAVKTGDTSPVSVYLMIALGAVMLVLLCVITIKRSGNRK